jgi:hypothetical protein
VPKYVLDTNIYLRSTRDDEWNRALEAFFLAFTAEIYLHSVVALELLAGAVNPELERSTQKRFIRPFERRDRVFTPSHGALPAMTTKLDKTLKREIDIDGQPYTVTISPDGVKLTQKGFRKGREMSWRSLWQGGTEEGSGGMSG